MVELHQLFVIVYAVTAALALVVTAVAWRRRTARGGPWLVMLMLGVTIWSGASAIMWAATTQDGQVFWMRVTALGFWMVPVGFLFLTFEIAGMTRWLTPRRTTIIALSSFLLANAEWLNPGRMFETSFSAEHLGPYIDYEPVPGPLYWAFYVFAAAVSLIALVIVFRVYRRSSGGERAQAVILLVGGCIPFLASLVTEIRFFNLGGLDLAPIAFLVTGTIWLVAIRRGDLLDVLPVARSVLVDQMTDGVVVIDDGGRVVEANPAALSLLGSPAAEVVDAAAADVFREVPGAAAVFGSDTSRIVLPLGMGDTRRFIEFGVTPLILGVGEAPARLVTLHDVTDERRANERLELARTVFDTVNEGIAVIGAGSRVIDVNDAACRLTGRSREDTVGKGVDLFRSDRHPPEFYVAIEKALRDQGEWEGEIWLTRDDGSVFPAWLSMSATGDGQDAGPGTVATFTDLTKIWDAEQLRHNATHDALTQLPDRRLLNDRLEHAVAVARRAGSGLAVLFIDLDGFKNVNDRLGHAQGDALLIEIARRLTPVLRESDTVGRHGGDEFIVLIADAPDLSQVALTALRLLEVVSEPCRLGDEDVSVTASIGIALFPTDGEDAATLIQHADLAMYGAKRLGRNRMRFFSEDLTERASTGDRG